MQFHCLPFGLCTAPFLFSKVTKPLMQFLRQLGVHLIIYLGDLLLAAPDSLQLMKNLSTALWLLTALDFVIKHSKSITHPAQQMEFLGFVIDTVTMTIALPPHKMEAIQKEASHLLESGSIQTRTLACLLAHW